MKAIQILMDESTLVALDREAAGVGSNRSKLIRAAVAAFLSERERQHRVQRCIEGYQERPQGREEYEPWQDIAFWPAE